MTLLKIKEREKGEKENRTKKDFWRNSKRLYPICFWWITITDLDALAKKYGNPRLEREKGREHKE